jgi:hypothetical protein
MQIGAEQWAALRLLECWLPLAQELNEAQGWGHDAPALQRLSVAAAPKLMAAQSVLAARAVLWQTRRELCAG